MVQDVRPNEPRYSCTVTVESLTGQQDGELITFGTSIEEVRQRAEDLLATTYGFTLEQIQELMQSAQVELLTALNSPSHLHQEL